MPFIQATGFDVKTLHINVHHFISVSKPRNQTLITMAAPGQAGPFGYVVDESVDEIMSRTQTALSHGPK